jgi:predicted TIM-barrel fold metal-dependent hydrolase
MAATEQGIAGRTLTGPIDVHTHLFTEDYLSQMRDAGVADVGGYPMPDWSLPAALDAMDEHGIAASVLSISAPGIDFVSGASAAALARSINEQQASIVRRYPSRFGALAILPLPDVDAALAELDHALGALALDGVVLFSNIAGIYLGDPRFAPLFAELNRRGTTVFVHPVPPPGFDEKTHGYPAPMLEFPFDSTRMVMSLIGSGTLRRCPNVRIVVPHGGGTVPYLAIRMARGIVRFSGIEPPMSQQEALAALGTLYYDLTAATHPTAMDGLLRIASSDRLLFGSDFPFMPANLIPAAKSAIAAHPAFDAAALDAIARGNASRLFPNLAARMRPTD